MTSKGQESTVLGIQQGLALRALKVEPGQILKTKKKHWGKICATHEDSQDQASQTVKSCWGRSSGYRAGIRTRVGTGLRGSGNESGTRAKVGAGSGGSGDRTGTRAGAGVILEDSGGEARIWEGTGTGMSASGARAGIRARTGAGAKVGTRMRAGVSAR